MTFSTDNASDPRPAGVDIAQKLDEINRSFYERHAHAFAGTRQHGWPGWSPLIAHLPSRPLRVLDLGCGNGRLAGFLDRGWCAEGGAVEVFTGLERCHALLEPARSQSLPFDTEWSAWDWTAVADGQAVDSPVTGARDWVTLFGVLHHVYGYERRLRLLRWAAASLRSGGVLAISLWDFGAHPRWDDKRLEWERYASEWGLDVAALETGDALLGWGGDGTVPRYCHWVSREEEGRLVAELDGIPGLEPGVLTGGSADFNRYWCWRRT